MIDFQAICADRDVNYENDTRKWAFRRLDSLTARESLSLSERKGELTVVQTLVELAAAAGCDVTEDDVLDGLSVREIQAIMDEVSHPTSLGE